MATALSRPSHQPTPHWRFLFSEIARLQRPFGRAAIWAPETIIRPHFGYSVTRFVSPHQFIQIRFVRP